MGLTTLQQQEEDKEEEEEEEGEEGEGGGSRRGGKEWRSFLMGSCPKAYVLIFTILIFSES